MDNNKMNLSEIAWGGVDWINLAQDKDQWQALANTITNLRFPYNVQNFYGTTGAFSRTHLHGVS
jgi:hypothetical protein